MESSLNNLIKYLNLTPDNKENCTIDNIILNNSITRAGLELASDVSKSKSYSKSIVGWGSKESNFLKTIDKDSRQKKIKKILNENTPAIFLSINFSKDYIYKEILFIANQNKIPLFSINLSLGEIIIKVSEYFLSISQEFEFIHGSLIVVNGVGTLILGHSGVGKSEVILELIQKGQTFISDDSVEVYKMGTDLYGRSSPITQDILEVRGIGLINVPFVYGTKSIQKNTKIDIVVKLLSEKKINDVDRLGDKGLKYKILNQEIPMIQIPILSGRNVSSLITAAVSVFLAKNAGMDPVKTIAIRTKKERKN